MRKNLRLTGLLAILPAFFPGLWAKAAGVPVPPVNLVVNSALCFSAMDNNPVYDEDIIPGQITLTSLLIQNGGSISYNDPGNPCSLAGAPNDGAQPVRIIVLNNMEIEAGGFISTDNKFQAGSAGAITISVGGTFIMRGKTGIIPGALISAITASTTGGMSGGAISIDAGNTTLEYGSIIRSESSKGNGGDISMTITGFLTLEGGAPSVGTISSSNTSGNGSGGTITIHVSGDINMEPGSSVLGNSGTGRGGTIEITGDNIDIDGHVYSRSNGSGTGCNFGHGGFISITAVKNLLVSDDGEISSKSNDPGADLVHLCACNVTIYGLVESTGSGHALPNGACGVTHLVPPYRPDKSPKSTAGVEIWAGNNLIINNLNHFGQINANLTSGQGNQCWIDLFAKNDITILGSTDPLDPFAVHANNGGSNNVGGTITIKTIDGTNSISGRAIQANGAFGGSGGLITIEANMNVDLNSSSMEAKGVSHNGGNINVRSFNGSILSNAGTTMNVSGPTAGAVTLTECGTTAFAGTVTPPPNPTPATLVCGGVPELPHGENQPTYVEFCECECYDGTITIIKVVLGTPPLAPWQFSSNIPGYENFTLPAGGGSITFTGLKDGVYTFTETNQLVPGTNLEYIASSTCSESIPNRPGYTNTVNENNSTLTGTLTMVNCQALSCTFTNRDPGYCQWCSKGAVLSQVRQNMGNDCAKPDIIVDLRLASTTVDPSKVGTDQPATGSLQAAINYMNNNDTQDGNNDGDFNGDGKLFIGVIATDCENTATACSPISRPPAGDSPHGSENVVVTNLHAGRMNIFGCSVTIWANDPSKPVITIENSIGKVTVLDIHVKYSNVEGYLVKNNGDLVVVKNSRAMFNDIGYHITGDNVQVTGAPQISNNRIGIQVDGNDNVLRTNSDIRDNSLYGIYLNNGNGSGNESNGNEIGVSGHPNGVGMMVSGNNNDMHDDNVSRNTGNGIVVSGAGNELDGEDINYNGGIGILVSGNNNTITDCRQTKNNGSDGFRVTGDNNWLEGNTAESNGGHGINADNANGADNNSLKKNQTKKNNLQGIRACGQINLGNNTGEDNLVDPQVAFTCGTNPKFLVVDISDDKAYKYDASFNLVSSSVLTSNNSDANDVTDNGTNTYVLDKNDKQVYRYAGVSAVSRVLKESGGGSLSAPSGIAISGNDMWVVDDSKKKIYRYSLSAAFSGSGNINALQQITFSGNNGDAEGLAMDATYLYVLDDNDKQFYRYPIAGGAGVASKVMKETGGGSLSSPTGAVIDGTSMWIVDKSKDKAYQYSLSSLFTGSGNLNASAQYSLYSENSDATGIAVGNSGNFPARGVTNNAEEILPKEYPALLVFPNPAKDNAMIQFTSTDAARYILNLIDETGRVVMIGTIEAKQGINIHELALGKFAKGMYLLVLKNDKEKLQKRILVE